MPQQHVQEHVDLIARHEAEFLARRTPAERRIDAIADFIGSLGFVVVHLCAFALWISWNCVPHVHHFDARPFSLLQTCVAMESLLAASFILMRQTRLARRSEEREHLMLQILLLSEREVTAVLNVEREIARSLNRSDIADAPNLEEFGRGTSIEEVAQTIQESITATTDPSISHADGALGLTGETSERLSSETDEPFEDAEGS